MYRVIYILHKQTFMYLACREACCGEIIQVLRFALRSSVRLSHLLVQMCNLLTLVPAIGVWHTSRISRTCVDLRNHPILFSLRLVCLLISLIVYLQTTLWLDITEIL